MERVKYDVIVVGAGPAGVTAAAAVARRGASVLLLEAGVYAGAENWSGCVYFTENLTDDAAFGPNAMDGAPYERRLVRRGIAATDGDALVGLSLQDPDTFRNCYTVLRPAFDPYWAEYAGRLGADYLPDTTVTSLIRRSGRVVGVHTERGPAYADVVFLAEGDASHLVRYEGLERVDAPDFMQGVKGVFSLAQEEIERRFDLAPGEGAAYEIVVRNPSLGGRTVHLNSGAFIYTNKDSLSVGYVVPLRNLAEHYKGAHDDLFSYMVTLPGIAEYLEGAQLSAFGTKLIRTGGMTQAPVLVEDGLAVGGAACGLGIDVPYPNFTGPASATGLYFGRAFADLSRAGKPMNAQNLGSTYLERLRASRYWKDADYLSDWPQYMERSAGLFGTSVDVACGKVRYLTAPEPFWRRWWLWGRFLRDYLKPRVVRQMLRENRQMLRALRLRGVVRRILSPKGALRWLGNSFLWPRKTPPRVQMMLRAGGKERTLRDFPLGVRGIAKRMLPALGEAATAIYRNDDTPLQERLERAVTAVARQIRLFDLVLGAFSGLVTLSAVLLSSLIDLFRYFVLRVPAEVMLKERVTNDNRQLRERRELKRLERRIDMAGRLATNTYVEGRNSHIRVLWPGSLEGHKDLAEAPYWSVCPAGVYAFEPSLTGHGVVTVSYENCIKCESCWQADSAEVRWGRHTDHRLIYRPETPALDIPAPALKGKKSRGPKLTPAPAMPEKTRRDKRFATALGELGRLDADARGALRAFEVAVGNIPSAADRTRLDWPRKVGETAIHRLRTLQAGLNESEIGLIPLLSGMETSPFALLSGALAEEVDDLASHLRNGDLFEAVGAARRVRDTVLAELAGLLDKAPPVVGMVDLESASDPFQPGPVEAALRERFTDPQVKTWDREGLEEDAAAELAGRFDTLPPFSETHPHPDETLDHLRAWGAIHPGVAMLALARVAARSLTGDTGGALVDGAGLALEKGENGSRLSGKLVLVPAALADHLVITLNGFGYSVPLDAPGVKRRRVPAGGLHPAGFETVDLDVTVPKGRVAAVPAEFDGFIARGYAVIALGAGDYLCRRALEQTVGRIQFPGQMQDTAGRDSIAKFGAVKALLTRTVAWRELLAALLQPGLQPPARSTELAALAAMAFCPKNGRMSYDAGQTFGGTAYSEDDLMARFYRDSAVFPYLSPGLGATERLAAEWGGDGPLPLAARLIPAAGDAFTGLTDGPFAETVQQWQRLAAKVDSLGSGSPESREALALALALFRMLVAAGEAFEAGMPSEGVRARLSTLLEELEGLIVRARARARRGAPYGIAHFPEMPEVAREPLALSYRELVAQDDPYSSGDFLRDTRYEAPRFIPEVQLHDPELRKTWADCYQWFLDHCSKAPDGKGPYEHYIERLHAIPPDMLEGFVKGGFFATVVPKELDGLGWKKIGYYLLVSGAMRFGDASLSLLIMASTSIGTTPVLLGLEKEIPLVEKELSGFRDDPERIGALRKALDAIVASLSRPDPGRLQRDFTRLVEMVDNTLRRTKVAKYLAQNFLKVFYTAALAGRRKDFAAFASGLREAQGLLAKLPDTLAAALSELPRRRRAHEQFLRALGHGAVAAFALTEPTAGSDSGGVTTTGHLKSVDLTPLEDGRYRFETDGGERFLLDADRIEYTAKGTQYRLPDGKLAAISAKGYDYGNDTGLRTVRVGRKELPFHDIAQVREGNRYEFYELSGAKMWITNGRVATQMSMYVKTDEGITGLMVDRHAEGLVIGRDEDKMGQKGSPTNEIAIDGARVPRECVIGYEGHGQVNALETLNVGRCGLAVASVVMGRRLLVEAKGGIPQSEERDRELAEIAARIFTNESLCYHLIGRFDNHATRSVRLESAIAKYVCSEMFHESLDRVETLWGPTGQTRDLLVEKMRRDARILNIYEGTNEVQRFLILKELCGMAKGWEPVPQPEEPGRAGAMARHKEGLRLAVLEAVETLGDAVWVDAAAQPAFFPLAEIAGELYLLDTALYRLEWLTEHRQVLGEAYADAMIAVGERGADQCLERIEQLFDCYRRGREQALNSRYPAESVGADTVMEQATVPVPGQGAFEGRLTVTCLLRPVAIPSPTPRLTPQGDLAEKVWHINPADEHALAAALALRSQSAGRVTVHVAACGRERGETVLRQALAAGADTATLLDLPAHASPPEWAEALKQAPDLEKSDVVACGAGCADADDPLGAFLSGCLNRPLVSVDGLSVTSDGKRIASAAEESGIDTPAVLAVKDASGRIRPTVAGYARAVRAPITRGKGPGKPLPIRFAPLSVGSTVTERADTVPGAAKLVHDFARAARLAAAAPYDGTWGKGHLPAETVVWVVAQGHELKASGPAFRAAATLARALDVPSRALLLGNGTDINTLAGLARDAGIAGCHGVNTKGQALSEAGRVKMVTQLTGHDAKGAPPRIVAPSGWETALGQAAAGLSGTVLPLAAVSGIRPDKRAIVLERQAYGERLLQVITANPASALLVTVPETAAFEAQAAVESFKAMTIALRLAKGDLDPGFVPPREGLTTAEVIVDVGYGAGSAEGMALAERLMEALRSLGLSPQMGATRKVTQGLGLLPQERQIGQTGVKVNPRLILALGISGAPQHVDYIGGRAHVLAFNKDPQAPLMTLERPGVTVHPLAGDLFATVPELIAALNSETGET